ncbi:FHA domain-containing protein [Luteimicrobium subarcticum]|uniref:FHA domain-containing protein n=1 Tax=Luteimicrobium subarcticum TaxID=620910 RepID=A0A2M8W3S9_9MICO|nr:FHA domain-containing protein [Luteimicrobium subarcticum]PJI85582.1 FHA domain-containing protein [Luteimicrobium subarcticum]
MTDPGAGTPGTFGPDTTATFRRADGGPDDVAATPGLTSEESSTVAALPWGSALLIMRRGTSTGERFLLDADRVTAGRSVHADIFLDDVTVSRKHAEFVREDGQFLVRDIGSLNGTYVNRNRIDQIALATNDEVQIGKFRLSFHASPARRPGTEGQAGPA